MLGRIGHVPGLSKTDGYRHIADHFARRRVTARNLLSRSGASRKNHDGDNEKHRLRPVIQNTFFHGPLPGCDFGLFAKNIGRPPYRKRPRLN